MKLKKFTFKDGFEIEATDYTTALAEYNSIKNPKKSKKKNEEKFEVTPEEVQEA